MTATDISLALTSRITDTPVRDWPFPHMYVENVFPDDDYDMLRRSLPDEEHYQLISETRRTSPGAYPQRKVLKLGHQPLDFLGRDHERFWTDLRDALTGAEFITAMVRVFGGVITERTGGGALSLAPELLLVRDRTSYAIGPHTDHPSRLMSLLFYLPPDDGLAAHGTSLYVPKNRAFSCPGGPHHRHRDFDLIMTMPYVANALFMFPKTEHSFHGVEEIDIGTAVRDVLLLNIRYRPTKTEPDAEA